MKKVVLLVIISLLLLSAAVYGGKIPPPYPGPRGGDLKGEDVYTVVKGDTMWEICGRKLDNPWLWVKVWERNPHITDPNWIYPGDKIIVSTRGTAKPSYVKPENREKYKDEDYSIKKFIFKEKAVADASLPEEVKDVSEEDEADDHFQDIIMRGGFILEHGVDPFAMVMSLDKEGSIASYGEIVYINKGSKSDIRVDDELIVYELGRAVKHPRTYKKLGEIVIPQGVIKVKAVEENLAKCEIIAQREPIERGSYVDFEYPRIVLNKKNIKPDYSGYLVYFNDDVTLAGKGTIVHIDRGMKQGIKAGMFFDIMGEAKKVKDPEGGIKVLPSEIKGRIQVISARENVSMGIILSSKGNEGISLGDVVEAE